MAKRRHRLTRPKNYRRKERERRERIAAVAAAAPPPVHAPPPPPPAPAVAAARVPLRSGLRGRLSPLLPGLPEVRRAPREEKKREEKVPAGGGNMEDQLRRLAIVRGARLTHTLENLPNHPEAFRAGHSHIANRDLDLENKAIDEPAAMYNNFITKMRIQMPSPVDLADKPLSVRTFIASLRYITSSILFYLFHVYDRHPPPAPGGSVGATGARTEVIGLQLIVPGEVRRAGRDPERQLRHSDFVFFRREEWVAALQAVDDLCRGPHLDGLFLQLHPFGDRMLGVALRMYIKIFGRIPGDMLPDGLLDDVDMQEYNDSIEFSEESDPGQFFADVFEGGFRGIDSIFYDMVIVLGGRRSVRELGDNAVHIAAPGGRDRPHVALSFTTVTSLFKKHSIWNPPDDGNCMIRAVSVFKRLRLARSNCVPGENKDEDLNQDEKHRQRCELYNKVVRNTKQQDLDTYVFLASVAGGKYQQGSAFESLSSLCEHLSTHFLCEVVVFNALECFSILYRSERRDAMQQCLLLHHDGHVALIKDSRAFFQQSNFCPYCCLAFNTVRHACEEHLCNLCLTMHPGTSAKNSPDLQDCAKCGRCAMLPACYKAHKLNGTCNQTHYCLKCKTFYRLNRARPHFCLISRCSLCHERLLKGEVHECYMQRLQPTAKDPVKVVVFDFECDQSTLTHEVNYWEAIDDSTGTNMKGRTALEFTEWAFTQKGRTFVAHNGRGYDFQFVLNVALNTGLRPKVIRKGRKIMYMEFPGYRIRFVDSLNFLSMPLSAFTTTFGLRELKKGFFPHLFNRPENQDYIGPWPDQDHYMPGSMSVVKKEEFQRWHAEHADKEFNFRREMEEYCHSDVVLLLAGVKAFREHINTVSRGLDPWSCVTLASLCLKIFRRNYLKPNQVAMLTHAQSKFIRRGFYGGRTETYKMHWKAEPGEYGEYLDVNSMYPWANTKCLYPVGHPEELFDETHVALTERWFLYRGLVECDVECPAGLYHPVLPEKHPSKQLLFTLRKKEHQVYPTPELLKAVSLGYKVTKVYRIMHWREWSTEIFSGYMNTFFREKQKATETKNQGMRSTMKLLNNSLWGKFVQNPVRDETLYLKSATDVYQLFCDERVQVKQVESYSNLVEVVLKRSEEYLHENPDPRVNVTIGAFTTCYARLRLYEGLEKLQRQVLYCDTDSIMFVRGGSERFGTDEDLIRGKELGDFASELSEGDHLQEFLSGGPKNYAYQTALGKEVIKIKGICLHSKNREVLHFDSIRQVVLGELSQLKTPEENRISRTKQKTLVNVKFSKVYRNTFAKRVLSSDNISSTLIDSVPHR